MLQETSLDSLLSRRTGRILRKVEQETTQEMVNPFSKGWVAVWSVPDLKRKTNKFRRGDL